MGQLHAQGSLVSSLIGSVMAIRIARHLLALLAGISWNAMDPIGTPLAVLGGLAWCYSFGCELVKRWHVFQEADFRIQEHALQLNDHCIRLDEQTKVLGLVWTRLDGRHQMHFHDLTQALQNNLRLASDSLTGADQRKPRRLQRLRRKASFEAMRYTFIYESVEEAIRKLESWHARFDSSFFLLTRMDFSIDSHIGEQQNAPGQPAQTLRRLQSAVGTIPNSSVSLALYGSQQVLVDTLIPDSQAELDRTSKSIYDLSEILKQSEPTCFNVLNCMGILYQPPSSATAFQPSFNLLFSIPSTLQKPTSLRAFLRRTKDSDVPLDDRVALAKGLAKGMMFVHSAKFVHKNIRPETIILFSDTKTGARALDKPFLMGFEQFRPADGWTQRKGDTNLEKHIYRHPSRQGLYPETDYNMQHDIYSLGVVLLEIGLWTSVVDYPSSKDGKAQPPPPKLLPFVGTKEILADTNERRRALALKKRMTEAAGYLPSRMGRIYTDVVLTCLNCLDAGDENLFGQESEFDDKEGIAVAVRFAEMVSPYVT
ncbi:uncharacterized protein AB675_1779 [Cyphellophora attinorum]|uniref:Protein kinase domain-containing protein n=1 Tax=Cyphellophora attinorum TaxID=1664694 RepID=A0A0N1HU48_9EURO|nr:uncharacterized protein AB675_1779 [Phialophora attinorum]KPI42800.1 hypothetical protein AB675_1779 [Phialophora attinorum]